MEQQARVNVCDQRTVAARNERRLLRWERQAEERARADFAAALDVFDSRR